MCVRAVLRARPPLRAPWAVEDPLLGYSDIQVAFKTRLPGVGRGSGSFDALVRGVSRTSAPVLAPPPDPDLAGRPETRLTGRHPPDEGELAWRLSATISCRPPVRRACSFAKVEKVWRR